MSEAIQRVIVVGLGSIGRRHARILAELGVEVALVSRRPGEAPYGSVETAVRALPASMLLIATETGDHAGSVQRARAAGHRGPVIVEKPVCSTREELTAFSGASGWTAYNLRFSPVVQALRRAIEEGSEPVVSVHAHVGQDLAQWRPDRSPEETYSAHRAQGGGVLRDLSHELDLVSWLFGRVEGVFALGGRRTEKTVDSDDCWTCLMRSAAGTDVGLSLNYLDLPARRFIHANTSNHTFMADLVAQTLSTDAKVSLHPSDRDQSYRSMWRAIMGADGPAARDDVCTLSEGLDIVRLIDDVETSARERRWVER